MRLETVQNRSELFMAPFPVNPFRISSEPFGTVLNYIWFIAFNPFRISSEPFETVLNYIWIIAFNPFRNSSEPFGTVLDYI